MGNATATSASVVLQIANSATQTSLSICTITCDQTLSNNTVIIAPGAVVGNILFQNICVIQDASCMIQENVDNSVTNILNSTIDQTSLSTQPIFSLTYDATKSSSSLSEIMTNQLQQMVSANCTIATNQELNNNYIYIGSGATAGDISFVQHSTLSNVECSMNIAATSTAYNQGTGNVSQTSATFDVCSIIIIGVIVVVVVAAVFIFIFLFRRVGTMKPKPPVPIASVVPPPPEPVPVAPVPVAATHSIVKPPSPAVHAHKP